MRGRGKLAWALGVVGLVVVLLASAAGLAVALFDPNDVKPRIVAAVRDATGRTLALNGPLRIGWSLWPTIEVTDVTLANLPGGSRPDIARAERIEARLSLPALLRREIEVAKLTLTGPNILFEQVGGAPNWVFGQAGPDVPASSGGGRAMTLRIREVEVRNGMLTWRFPARTKVLGVRSLSLRHPAADAPLDLAAVLVYGDNAPFSVAGSAQPTGGWRAPWTTKIAFEAFDTVASAAGTADVAGAFDMQVEGKSGALDKLNGLLPEMNLPPIRGLTVSTRLRNGPALGELPVVGATRIRFDGAELGRRVAGLSLGKTELSLAEAGGAATVAAAGQFAGQPFEVAGTFGVPARLEGRVSLPVDLTAKAAGRLALKGQLALNALRFAGVDAAVSLQAPSLAAFRPALGAALPALGDVRLDGRLVAPANGATVAFKGAKLTTREGDVAGDWTLGAGDTLRMEGQLTSAQLDLDAVLRAFGVELPAAPAVGAVSGPVISTAPLPWAALRGPAVDLSARIGSMAFQGQAWKDVRFRVVLKDGRLNVAPVSLALPGGPLQMSLAVDASHDAAAVQVEMHAPGIPLALMAHYAGLPGPMAGAVRVEAKLRGAGRNPHEISASLAGPVSATMGAGRMTNAAFIQLTAASLEALGIQVPAQGETAVRCFGLIGAFNGGVVRLDTVALDTSHLQLDGTGQVDFAHETVAFNLRPLVQVAGSQVAAPVVVEGPFRSVHGRLNATGFDKVGLFVNGLFGGDESTACADAGLAPRPGGRAP